MDAKIQDIISRLCATIDPDNQTETCSFRLTCLDTMATCSAQLIPYIDVDIGLVV